MKQVNHKFSQLIKFRLSYFFPQGIHFATFLNLDVKKFMNSRIISWSLRNRDWRGFVGKGTNKYFCIAKQTAFAWR